MFWRDYYNPMRVTDYGPNPFIVDIEKVTLENPNYRSILWTANNLQVSLMNIPVGGEIGLEVHPNTDQFLRLESGTGLVQMGKNKNNLSIQTYVYENSAVMVPAGTWHNIINVGNQPMKLYTLYAPPQHPFGTVEPVKPNE